MSNQTCGLRADEPPKKILILGVNGFIGHHLAKRILETTNYEIYSMDMRNDRLDDLISHERFHFFDGDMTIHKEWIECHVDKCDVILPLAGIATPATYVEDPLRVFHLDFEANLHIVRLAVRYQKHLIFPSTSEVYGMCPNDEFDSNGSVMTYGPINKTRWIYACSKQLMDRIIWAYGLEKNLTFTLFRPFNWIGSGLDSLSEQGRSRVVTEFLGQILRGENIRLVNGGEQKRVFTDVEDGVDALLKIITNQNGIAIGKIYNIGNPANHLSIRELANQILTIAREFPRFTRLLDRVRLTDVSADEYYGVGYQDMQDRMPKIENTVKDLTWEPTTSIDTTLRKIFSTYCSQLLQKEISFKEQQT